MSVKTDIAGDPQTINLSDLELKFDSSTVTGGATVALGPRPGLGVSLNVDKINIDDYLVPVSADDEDGDSDPFGRLPMRI